MAAVSWAGERGAAQSSGAQKRRQRCKRSRQLISQPPPYTHTHKSATGSTGQPKAVFERADRQASHRQAQVGNGVQRCVCEHTVVVVHQKERDWTSVVVGSRWTSGLQPCGANASPQITHSAAEQRARLLHPSRRHARGSLQSRRIGPSLHNHQQRNRCCFAFSHAPTADPPPLK